MPDRFRAGKRLWEAVDDALLVARYPHEPTLALARDLRRSLVAVYGRANVLGLTKSAEYMASPDACRLRRGDHPGVPFRVEEVGRRANLEPAGGYWRANLGRLRSLGLVSRRGPLQALPVLFLEGAA